MRALVVYGSSRGGTAGLAAMLGVVLRRHGLDVTVQPAGEVEDLTTYDAVIVGGALYNNRWHTDAVDFVHRFKSALLTRAVWFFSSGPLDDSARSGSIAPVPQVRELARVTDVRGHMTFGGVLEKRPSSRLAALLSYGPAGDWRDPRQVAQWADRILVQLDEPHTAIALPEPDARSQPRSRGAVRQEPEPLVLLDDAEPGALESSGDAYPDSGGGGLIRRFLSLDEAEEDVGLDVLVD